MKQIFLLGIYGKCTKTIVKKFALRYNGRNVFWGKVLPQKENRKRGHGI
jgi:hypothetical protein